MILGFPQLVPSHWSCLQRIIFNENFLLQARTLENYIRWTPGLVRNAAKSTVTYQICDSICDSYTIRHTCNAISATNLSRLICTCEDISWVLMEHLCIMTKCLIIWNFLISILRIKLAYVIILKKETILEFISDFLLLKIINLYRTIEIRNQNWLLP